MLNANALGKSQRSGFFTASQSGLSLLASGIPVRILGRFLITLRRMVATINLQKWTRVCDALVHFLGE